MSVGEGCFRQNPRKNVILQDDKSRICAPHAVLVLMNVEGFITVMTVVIFFL
jgi:hypothetical protein